MTTTINHKIRLELALTCNEYCFLDYIYHSKKKSFTSKDLYTHIGFEDDDIREVMRALKHATLIETEGNKIWTTSDWNKYFDKKKVFSAPLEDDVVQYFKENGYSEIAAKKAYKYYDTAEWSDSTGKKIKNWKQKMIGVWFKDENKAPKIVEAIAECPYTKQQLWEAQHYYESDGVVPSWFDKQYLHLIR